MESYEQKRRRIFGRNLHLKQYLQLIDEIIIGTYKLMSIEETDRILQLNQSRAIVKRIEFTDSEQYTIRRLVFDYFKDTDQPFIIGTLRSSDCGMIEVKDLDGFNFNFHVANVVKLDPNSIITISSLSLNKEVVIDITKEDGFTICLEFRENI